ncbi:efflux RND transporter periplasmic adaptor subunit [Pseudomonas sp. MWU16-30317]|uniref:efflux RND transporter periplasmic adaptor subunit n=1 Tax=Pseudomonas sp. MWU16-30317 TaxID=2878095 RepID=UPI001CFA012B|nr:efflux RND transporter periplasmic adaptor subunit [Pseudomonas sp. MWU16-30317]
MSSNPTPSRKRLMVAGISGLTLAAVLVGVGLSARSRDAHAVQAWTESQAIPVVSTFAPSVNAQGDTLSLPAHLQAWNMAPINARVSGYLKDWKADIGTQVQAGQVLADIDSPELDQQMAQAYAHLLQQKASAQLASSTAQRWQHLLDTHSVSQQEVDEKVSSAAVAKADVQAAEADYARLKDLEAYKTIRAPFTGTITARNTDIGQLIKADDGGTTSLFTIADTRRLRLYIPVPQNYASAVHPGLQVQLTVPEHPGKTYTATLLGDSTSVDPRSGTLLAQFVADNPDGALMPGDYADTTVKVAADLHAVSIPSSALIFRAQGTQVAVLDASNHVHMRDIHIGLDLGARLVIDQGLATKDRVVDNPPDALRENDPVKLAETGVAHAPKA